MYVRLHVCTSTCMYVYMYVCLHVCASVHPMCDLLCIVGKLRLSATWSTLHDIVYCEMSKETVFILTKFYVVKSLHSYFIFMLHILRWLSYLAWRINIDTFHSDCSCHNTDRFILRSDIQVWLILTHTGMTRISYYTGMTHINCHSGMTRISCYTGMNHINCHSGMTRISDYTGMTHINCHSGMTHISCYRGMTHSNCHSGMTRISCYRGMTRINWRGAVSAHHFCLC